MRGASVALSATLMLVIAITAAAGFFAYINMFKADVESSGQGQLVELEIPPKLMALVCYSGYGYIYLSLSQGQNEINGTVLYRVEKDTGDLVKEQFINISMDAPKKIYLPVNFNTGDRYKVTISGRKWGMSDYCTPVNDPFMVLHLKLNEGSGTTAGDSSGHGNDCIINGATWVTNPNGTFLEFDGSSSYLDCGAVDKFNSTQFTVFTWARLNDLDFDHSLWGGFNTAGQAKNYIWVDSDDSVKIDQSPPAGGEVSSLSITPNVWYNIIATRDSSVSAIYISGQLSNSSAAESYTGAALAKWAVGYKYAGSPTAYFNGTLAELRVYSRALAPEEIEAIYAAYTG